MPAISRSSSEPASECDLVVVSLFVNPAQFTEHADLEHYPRREEHDVGLADGAGVDVLFAPSVEEVYPAGFATSVEVLGVTDRLEGVARGAEHFRGVSTVVTKLLCMVMPDVAYFGQKDAQQLRRDPPAGRRPQHAVTIEACPTVREADGLAMSSRNALLSPEERARALALPAALDAARGLASRRRARRVEVLAERRARRDAPFGVRAEYLELVDPNTLEPIEYLAQPGAARDRRAHRRRSG